VDWDARWQSFAGGESPIESADDIPWPASGDEDNPFYLSRDMPEEEQLAYLRDMLRRFHTDKFESQFRDRLSIAAEGASELSSIRTRLNDLAAKASELYRNLKGDRTSDD